MTNYLLKLLLLGTFAFWASGTAKFVHVQMEHHGKLESFDDDDDDDNDSGSIVIPATTAAQSGVNHQSSRVHHHCPICEMLAAMVVDYCNPPALPQISLETIGLLTIADWQAPILALEYSEPARGPPRTPRF